MVWIDLNDLGVNRDECIAIEDSLDSALSALKAKIECIAFPGLFHMDDDFSFCKKCLNKLDISIDLHMEVKKKMEKAKSQYGDFENVKHKNLLGGLKYRWFNILRYKLMRFY